MESFGSGRTMKRTLIGFILGSLVLGCGCSSAKEEVAPTPLPTSIVTGRRFAVPDGGNPGISGADSDAAGVVWMVPERRRVLLRLREREGVLELAGAPLAIEGVPEGLDTESLAVLGEGRLVLGTEAQRTRDHDLLLFAERRGERVAVVESVALDYGGWRREAPRNKGIEGLCAAAGRLLVGVEWVIQNGLLRYAPIAVYDLDERKWSYHRLRLSSGTGKLASLWCAAEGDHLAAWAIERHYGVNRILRFEVPLSGAVRDLVPSRVDVLADERDSLNYEGIVRAADGTPILISDNQLGVALHGPTTGWRPQNEATR